MKPTIKLNRNPKRQERDIVDLLSQKDCECTEKMKAESDAGNHDEEICKPCGARQILNGIVTLAETVKG